MDEPIIKVESLGKRYRIGGRRHRYFTLRESLVGAAAGAWRRARSLLAGAAPGQGAEAFWALKDVSFEVRQGEVMGIIGRNGAGKTTLLKILSRITEPTEGRAELVGRVGSLLEVGTGFHPELTGRENIYLSGAILGMRKAEIDRKFDEIAAFAEVEKFLETPVKRYSTGMQVRLGFAVAAHLDPEILLIDEVLAVGDVGFQKKCLGKMSEVAKGGRTVLFVSHNMAAVQNLCSKALLLLDGCISACGETSGIVNLYLSSYERRLSTRNGPLAKSADDSVELLSVVAPAREEGEPAVAQSGQDFCLELTLRASRPRRDLVVTVGINNAYDVRIATLHSRIAGANLSLVPGVSSVLCRIPRFPLVPGRYILDIKVLSGQEPLIWAPRLTRFTVEVGDFYDTGRLPDPSWGGVCYLSQDWELRRE